jgi:16S rRNA processing protein RimM
MPQKNDNDAGLHINGEPAFLVLGKLRRPHGVQGEIPLEIYTHLLDLLAPGCVVYVGDAHQPYTIEKTRWKQKLLLLKLAKINDRTIVSALTNELVYIKTSELPSLPEDDFYYHQLIGLQVFEEDGRYLGVLVEILETGANDVYLIKDEAGDEVLIPAIEEVVLDIDLDQDKMIVSRMAWYGEGD